MQSASILMAMAIIASASAFAPMPLSAPSLSRSSLRSINLAPRAIPRAAKLPLVSMAAGDAAQQGQRKGFAKLVGKAAATITAATLLFGTSAMAATRVAENKDLLNNARVEQQDTKLVAMVTGKTYQSFIC